jgi:hypothetical protein
MRRIFTLSLLIANLFIHQSIRAADFFVTSTLNSGPGTLRQAILDAAANGTGQDNIFFNLTPLTGNPFRINLTSPILVNTAVFIDGYSQASSNQGTITDRTIWIGLNFSGTNPINQNQDGLVISAGNVTVRGLAIYRAARGIVVTSSAGVDGPVRIQGNYIGVAPDGLPIVSFGSFNIYSSANLSHGVFIDQTSSGYVTPRVFVGTDGDGTNDANEGNLISRNGGDGIFVNIADHNVIAGNFIGTNPAGARSNYTYPNNNGITLNGNNVGDGAANNRIGTDGNNVSDALEANVIGGNSSNGILIQSSSTNNIVAGNVIGFSFQTGVAAANGIGVLDENDIVISPTFPDGNGIFLSNVSGNIIGVTPGTTGVAAQRNYIGHSTYNGILLYSSTSSGLVQNNLIMGNAIGLSQFGSAGGNERWGVFLSNSTSGTLVSNNLIGSDDDGIGDALEGNIITANKRDGVGLFQNVDNTVVSNRISRNSMYANSSSSGTEGFGLGINLMTSMTDGTTINGTVSSGPNNIIAYPDFTFFLDDAVQKVRIMGICPPGSYVQFYLASPDANQDNSAFNEGQTFLFGRSEGSSQDLDPVSGQYNFLLTYAQLAAAIGTGSNVVGLSHSTASGAGNTSEFSQRKQVTLAVLPVQLVNFNAALRNNEVLVTWSTANEQNASHFDVERSSNGTDFNRIGTVKARGNSNSLVNYSHSDANPLSGVSYYRLRQVDLDNRFSYSKTVVVRNDADGRAFSVWPNPVLDNMNITLTSDRNQNLNLRVVDPNGRVVRNQVVHASKGMNQITVNMNTLTKGMYLVQVVGENLNLSERVIKQ